MKIRLGFVSNSSSSSYLIQTDSLTPEQINYIRNYTAWYILKYGVECDECWKVIDLDFSRMVIRTDMDNFELLGFLYELGIPDEVFSDTPAAIEATLL